VLISESGERMAWKSGRFIMRLVIDDPEGEYLAGGGNRALAIEAMRVFDECPGFKGAGQ